jgi:hypothetical protein
MTAHSRALALRSRCRNGDMGVDPLSFIFFFALRKNTDELSREIIKNWKEKLRENDTVKKALSCFICCIVRLVLA